MQYRKLAVVHGYMKIFILFVNLMKQFLKENILLILILLKIYLIILDMKFIYKMIETIVFKFRN